MPEIIHLWFHITRRNWMVYRKDLIANIAPTAVEPFIMLASIGVGVGSYIADVHGRSYVSFLAPGLAVSSALFTSFFESSYGFYVRLTFENIFKAMLTTPIGPAEVILGEFIWVGLKGGAMYTGLTAILAACGFVKNPELLVFAPLVGIVLALPCGAFGFLSSSFIRNINQFQSVYTFFISPLFFFSGIFFPIEQMPVALQWAAKALPLYHGIRLSQCLFWDEMPPEGLLIHVLALIGFGILFCTWAFFRIRRLLRED